MLDAPTISPNDDLLTIPQVARRLGVTRYTAYIYALRGRLRARDAAGRLVVRREDLEQFIRDRQADQ